MFSTFKQRLLLGVYVFILVSIPVGAFLASQYRTTVKSSASEQKDTKLPLQVPPKPSSAAKQLLKDSQKAVSDSNTTPSSSPSVESPTIATSYGPTLSLKVVLEGRPKSNQATKLFVGIAEGTLTANPKFVLSFSVDVPASGEYSNLSLAGLNPGSTYTALLKGSAQIAKSVTFTMSPAMTNLNDGQSVNLISGDLNEDNVVNNADLTIAQKAIGSSGNADLNKDGVINIFDLGIISKNIGQTGDSGVWTSPIPKVATPSAGSPGGYWLWLPK